LSLVYSDEATAALHRADRIAKECGLLESNLQVSTAHVNKLIAARKRSKAST